MSGIVKAHILGEDEALADAVGRSAQIPEDSWDYGKTGAKEPPYNLDALCLFLEVNTWHYRCVKAKAISTAGLGYDFIVPDGVKAPDPAHKTALKEFFDHPNDEMTWGEILENVLTDFEALGNGYFEVVRNRLGEGPPRAIYHIPAVTVRVRKDKKGFIQVRDNKMVYFRNFGSDPKAPDSFDPRDADKPQGKRRLLNEVIHLKNYHPRSSYYGLPDFLPALRALVGNKKAGDFNISFFENNAVPQYAIIVKGGELAKGTRKRIEEYFRSHIKGSAHKTLILEIVQDEGEKVDLEIKPLAVEVKDASFQMFRADNAEEIRVAHGVPGRLIGLTEKGGLGGAGEGATQQEIFKYHVIEPKQTRLEYRINNFLIKRGFGFADWELRFKEIDVTDEAKASEIVDRLVRLGILTINEGRREVGQKPLEHPGADVPFMMTSIGPLSLDTLEQGGVRPQMVPRPETVERAFEKASPDQIGRIQAAYAQALRKVLSGKLDAVESLDFTRAGEEVLAEAGRILGPDLVDEATPIMRQYLERSFRAGQVVRGVGRQIQTLFDLPRQEAVDWLVRHDRFWLGNVFPENLRDPFRETVTQGLEEGIGRKAIGSRLRMLVEGTKEVAGKAELYDRVASANVARANNWGGMFSLEAAGIETYVWRAVGDERGCVRCASFDGKTFGVAPAMSLVRRALVSPPEAIENLSPWPVEDLGRGELYIETSRGRESITGRDSPWLQERGMGVPPLHPACRCVLVVG